VVDNLVRLIVVTALVAGCAGGGPPADEPATGRARPAVSVLLVGDAMLGRSVAPIVAADAEGVFRDVRRIVRKADVAAVNVESPLTLRLHTSPNPFRLEAAPATAGLLAGAGFDVAALANNHTGDAGPASVLDSVRAVVDAGMVPVGAGADLDTAWRPAIVDVEGVRVAFLAIEAIGQGMPATGTSPGVATWDPEMARAAVAAAQEIADVVVVGVHGGIPYHAGPDPVVDPIVEQLATWGVDVVWGHGPHVRRPAAAVDPDRDGHITLAAPSLGNFLFDQRADDATSTGSILEVLVDAAGVVAHRIGTETHEDLRVHFSGWEPPEGDAVLLDGEWWILDRAVGLVDTTIPYEPSDDGVVVSAAQGDMDLDGIPEVVVSYRHPLRIKPHELLAPPATDTAGRSAHLGVFDAEGRPLWLSRRPPHPVGALAACDGSAAFAYTTLDADAVIATAAGVWTGFGFVADAELPGPGTVACADVDHDGRLDPVVLRRGASHGLGDDPPAR